MLITDVLTYYRLTLIQWSGSLLLMDRFLKEEDPLKGDMKKTAQNYTMPLLL